MAEPLPPAAAVAAVRALAAARRSWTVLIDGGSGAGKSTLADLLVAATGAVLVRLDDLYPGWDGLAAGAEAVRRDLLVPRATGRAGTWRRWDWASDAPAERSVVPAGGGLVCEGSGVLTRASAPLADLAVWVDLDEPERRRRAIARDGEPYARQWRRWAAQEAAAIAVQEPQRLAGLVVDGRSLPQPMVSDLTEDAH
ncbi:AAA family ATPase [Amnibacterium soli]|uniref:AAA family ATPase n=1 Tax=Amnibacterium soli TaxID=1282736 RepID=A0ABP8Z3R3_9MICO